MSASEYRVDVQLETEIEDAIVAEVRRAAEATLVHEAVESPAQLTVLLTDSESVRRLNRTYRDRDETTDVLSFPSGEPLPGGQRYLGDIAISVPVALNQAARAGHDLSAELALLTIHGVLHLLGHDHTEADDKQRMWQTQKQLLSHLGLEATPTEE